VVEAVAQADFQVLLPTQGAAAGVVVLVGILQFLYLRFTFQIGYMFLPVEADLVGHHLHQLVMLVV
jgi:hypothetical protein